MYRILLVPYLWERGAKTAGPIAKKVFLNLIFKSVRIFNAIHSVIKKILHKGPLPNCLSEMTYFIFGYFSTKFGTSVVA
jgi:hypothetical protein